MPEAKKWSPNHRLAALFFGVILPVWIGLFAFQTKDTGAIVMFSLCLAISLVVGVAVYFRWVIVEPPEITIAQAIGSLAKNEPCDREELKRCCRCFPQSAALTELAELPTDVAVPRELLARVVQQLPQVWDPLRKRSPVMKIAMILPMAIVILLIIATLVVYAFHL